MVAESLCGNPRRVVARRRSLSEVRRVGFQSAIESLSRKIRALPASTDNKVLRVFYWILAVILHVPLALLVLPSALFESIEQEQARRGNL